MTMVTDLLRSRPAAGAGGGDILPNYWNPQRLDPDIILPSGGIAASVVCGAGAWGAWGVIQAASAADYVLVTAQFSKVVAGSGSFWVEVGIGPLQGESPIAAFGDHVFFSGAGASGVVSRTYRLEPHLIPAGSRIVARGWDTTGNASSRIMLSLIRASPLATWYSPWPNTYIGGGRATNLWRSPAVAGWTGITNPAGGWTTVLAVAPNDLLFNACEFDPTNAGGGQGNVLELAVGAAGAEQILSRVPIGAVCVLAYCLGYCEAGRKGIIFSGERVSARMGFGPAGPWRMGFYFESV